MPRCRSQDEAQQHTEKRLTGRWRSNHNNHIGDILFLSNDTAAFISPNGLLYGYITYNADFKRDMIRLKYTVDIHRKKNPYYMDAEIRFLNDSTFLYKSAGTIPGNADTSTKNLRVYKIVKFEKPGTQLRLPTCNDLKGQWSNFFKGEIKDDHIIFIDDHQVIFKRGIYIKELTYKVDFTKQPVTIDFYYTDSSQMLQAFLMFEEENMFRIEFFPKNDRGDHLMVFGHNMMYLKEKGGE